ncbi:hypothetical protein L2E82_16040 [Cichorium intybus]|uniref:Uncharacterized protein n=1 Tax=Cichorium intybus TaxID=13427 RepID=A0ACB9F5E7_CICIN|nr:hypothetical protein L2E82_16040 [Cichorium intybus]
MEFWKPILKMKVRAFRRWRFQAVAEVEEKRRRRDEGGGDLDCYFKELTITIKLEPSISNGSQIRICNKIPLIAPLRTSISHDGDNRDRVLGTRLSRQHPQ